MRELRVTSPLLTADQACAYLLLDVEATTGEPVPSSAAHKRLILLVDKKKIVTVVVGKHRRYLISELDRYLAAELEARR